MQHDAFAQTTPHTAAHSANPDVAAGAGAIAIAPPSYGMDVADNAPTEAMLAQQHTAPATQGLIQVKGGAAADDNTAAGRAHGTGLPERLKAGIETLSGLSMDDVRVHYNSSKPAQFQALAYTQGVEIHIGPGQERHLPHEAWHVVQQKQGRVRATAQMKGGVAINDDAALEREADVIGRRAAQLQGAAHEPGPSPIAAAQDHDPAAVQCAALVRVSAPIPAGGGSYKLIAGIGERSVGSVMVHAGNRDAVEVTDLGVEQAHRAQGIGKLLIASAARTGQQLGKARMALAAQDTGSGRLTQWYKHMGFAPVGVHHSGHPHLEAPIGRMIRDVAQPGDGLDDRLRRAATGKSGHTIQKYSGKIQMMRKHIDDTRVLPGAQVPSRETVLEHTRLRITVFIRLLAEAVKKVLDNGGTVTNKLFTDTAAAQVGTGFRLQGGKEARHDAAHISRLTFNIYEYYKAINQPPSMMPTQSMQSLEEMSAATTNEWQTTNLGPDKVIDSIQTTLKNKWLVPTLKKIDRAILLQWLNEYIQEVKKQIGAKLPQKTGPGAHQIANDAWTVAHAAVVECEQNIESIVHDIAADVGLK
jgi:GNAT superfamily N-acetyltransferase